MQRFDVSRVGKRVRGTLATPWQLGFDTRSRVLAFGAGLFVGIAIGAYLGLGPCRALAAKASERARDVGGELIERARDGVDRATKGQAFVALSAEPEPLAGSTRDPEQDLEGRSV
jgi:hypothetical protein